MSSKPCTCRHLSNRVKPYVTIGFQSKIPLEGVLQFHLLTHQKSTLNLTHQYLTLHSSTKKTARPALQAVKRKPVHPSKGLVGFGFLSLLGGLLCCDQGEVRALLLHPGRSQEPVAVTDTNPPAVLRRTGVGGLHRDSFVSLGDE